MSALAIFLIVYAAGAAWLASLFYTAPLID